MKISIITFLCLLSVCCSASKSGEVVEVPANLTGTPRENMRNFVQKISALAKNIDSDFVVIPQNGHDIITEHSDPSETPDRKYLDAIDGIGREDLFYGYENDNEKTEANVSKEIVAFLNIYNRNSIKVLVTDYASTIAKMADSYSTNGGLGFVSFCADHRDLDDIPTYPSRPQGENSSDVANLGNVQNFLYILDPGNTDYFQDRADYLAKLGNTNFDLLIIDAFYGDVLLTPEEVQSLKVKANGGGRMVVAYMSIGEAENYRYYWQSSWNSRPPHWIKTENPDFEGNFIVEYWDTAWQDIILGNDNSYLKKLLDSKFDGVYLDIIDAFEFFEQ